MLEEVHMWRGTAEQRACRHTVRKLGQFAYFDQQLGHPDWRGKQVLDFGGNKGDLLFNRDCVIQPEDYWSVDIVREALELGRQQWPQAHWVHYNRFNCSFNPDGIVDLPVPDLGVAFSMILAYSVFTHTTREDMHHLVRQLRGQLAQDGILAFTFLDPDYVGFPENHQTNLDYRLKRLRAFHPGLNPPRLLEKARGAEWCSLVDDELFVNGNGNWINESEKCMTYHVYYTAEFLQREFSDAIIRQPVHGEPHHCCVLGPL